MGLPELVCKGWAVQALAVPVLSSRKGPGVLRCLEGDFWKGESTKSTAGQWLLFLGFVRQFLGSGSGQQSSLGLWPLPSVRLASLACSFHMLSWGRSLSWRLIALPDYSEPARSCGQPAPCVDIGADVLALLVQLPCPMGEAALQPAHVVCRASLCFLFLLALEVVSPRPGQRESCMYSGPQEDPLLPPPLRDCF